MKRKGTPLLLLLAITALLNNGCRKNSHGHAKETVLTKIFENGVIADEYQYNDNRQLQTHISYNASGDPFNIGEHTYNDQGRLQQILHSNPAGKPTVLETFTTHPNGKYDIHEYYFLTGPDSGKLQFRTRFTYNDAGRIHKETWLHPETGQELHYREYTYYKNGNIKEYRYYEYKFAIPGNVLAWTIFYSPQGDPVPEALEKTDGFPITSYLPLYTAEMGNYTGYDGGLVVTQRDDAVTDRTYDSAGNLKQMVITSYFLLPVKPKDTRILTFEYEEI